MSFLQEYNAGDYQPPNDATKVKLDNLSKLLGTDIYVIDDKAIKWKKTKDAFYMDKSFLNKTINLMDLGIELDAYYGYGGDRSHTNSILHIILTRFSTKIPNETKGQLIKSLESDKAALKETLGITNPFYESINKAILSNDNLLPILSDRVVYEDGNSTKGQLRSFELFKQHTTLQKSPSESCIQLRNLVFDSNDELKQFFSKSEFYHEMPTIDDIRTVVSEICNNENELQNKQQNIVVCSTNELIEKSREIFERNKNKSEGIYSFIVGDGHYTSITIAIKNNELKILGTDSTAGDDGHKIMSYLVSHLKDTYKNMNIEHAYQRYNSQKNSGLCGVYSILDTLNIQLQEPRKVRELMDKAIVFEKNEQYLAEKILRISLKLENKNLDSEKRNHLEHKIFEYIMYLNAMRYTRENPDDKVINENKLKQISIDNSYRSKSNFLGNYSAKGFFDRANESGLYKNSAMSDIDAVKEHSKNFEQVIDKYCKNEELIDKFLSSYFPKNDGSISTEKFSKIQQDAKKKLEILGEIITGNVDIKYLTSFKGNSEITKINNRTSLKTKKTEDMLRKAEKEREIYTLTEKLKSNIGMDEKKDTFLEIGKIHRELGNYKSALLTYKKALKIYPKDYDLMKGYKAVFDEKPPFFKSRWKNYLDSYKIQRKIIEDKKIKDIKADLNQALDSGNIAKAIKNCKRFLKIRPDDIGIRTTYAQILTKENDYKGALRQYDEGIKVIDKNIKNNPQDPELHIQKAEIYLKIHNLENSNVEHSDVEIGNKVKAMNSMIDAVNIYAKNNELSKAVEACERLIELSPNNIDNLLKIGRAFETTNCYSEARDYYKKAHEAIKDREQIYHNEKDNQKSQYYSNLKEQVTKKIKSIQRFIEPKQEKSEPKTISIRKLSERTRE